MDDPDAPNGTFTHWLVYDLDPKSIDIGEDHAPKSARQGINDYGEVQYGGPQPPSGIHRYFFHLFALDKNLDLPRRSERVTVEEAMEGHILDRAELMGRFASESSVPPGP